MGVGPERGPGAGLVAAEQARRNVMRIERIGVLNNLRSGRSATRVRQILDYMSTVRQDPYALPEQQAGWIAAIPARSLKPVKIYWKKASASKADLSWHPAAMHRYLCRR